MTSNRVPWARTLPILAPLSTAQSARPGRFQHLQALCQKVLVPSVQQEKRRNWAAMISQIAPRLPQQARMRFGSLFLCQFHSHPLPRTSGPQVKDPHVSNLRTRGRHLRSGGGASGSQSRCASHGWSTDRYVPTCVCARASYTGGQGGRRDTNMCTQTTECVCRTR